MTTPAEPPIAYPTRYVVKLRQDHAKEKQRLLECLDQRDERMGKLEAEVATLKAAIEELRQKNVPRETVEKTKETA